MVYKLKSKKKKVHSAKWDRCVMKVRKKGTSANPYAVCTARLGRKSFVAKRK